MLTTKMLEAIVKPVSKTGMSITFDLRELVRAGIEAAIVFPPEAEEGGEVVIHLYTSFDDELYDDIDFMQFTVLAPKPVPVIDDVPPTPQTVTKIFLGHSFISPFPLVAANYIRTVVENKSVNVAVQAVVKGLGETGEEAARRMAVGFRAERENRQ